MHLFGEGELLARRRPKKITESIDSEDVIFFRIFFGQTESLWDSGGLSVNPLGAL